jgi:hypothetical protein
MAQSRWSLLAHYRKSYEKVLKGFSQICPTQSSLVTNKKIFTLKNEFEKIVAPSRRIQTFF